jgi:hypothetical protein
MHSPSQGRSMLDPDVALKLHGIDLGGMTELNGVVNESRFVYGYSGGAKYQLKTYLKFYIGRG